MIADPAAPRAGPAGSVALPREADPAAGGIWGTLCVLFAVLVLAAQAWTWGSTLTYVGKPFAGFRFEPTLTVSSIGAASWSGVKAGLAQQDRLLAIDGVAATTPADLWRRVRSVPVGTRIVYRVTGDAGRREVPVPTANFTAFDWIATILPHALVAGAFWLIGILGFAMRRQNAAARVHLAFTTAMAGYFALTTEYDYEGALGRIYPACIFLLGGAALHLGLSFPIRARIAERLPWLVPALYAPAVVLGGAAAVAYRPAAQAGNPLYDLHHTLYWDVGAPWLLLGVAGLLCALGARAFRPPTLLAGQQAKVALYGATLAFVPMAVLWGLPTVLLVDPQAATLLANSALAFFLFFPIAVGYAIVRTQLFDIDLVIKRTLQYAALASVLGAVYFGITVGLGYGLQTVLPRGATEVTNAVAAAVVAFAFAPLSYRTGRFLDRVFARGTYDATLVLFDFTHAARHATDGQALFEAFRVALDRSFRPVAVSMAVPKLADFTAGDTSAMVLSEPLLAGSESLGVAAIGPKHSDLPYTAGDRAFFAAITQQLALAVENNVLINRIRAQERVTKELEIAHQVQAGLLPTLLPDIPDTRLAAHNQAALEMGGDFYDFFPLQAGGWGIVLGDVSGKGMPAALLGAVCLTLFRAIAPHHSSPIEALEAINRVLLRHRASKKMFVAVTYLVYHPDSGWVIGVNAGNPAPLHSGVAIASKGLPLGFAHSARYCDFELLLSEGETLVLLSDGMTDARNDQGQRYGDDRFGALIAQHADADPRDLISAVNAEITEFQGAKSLYDDLTIVALRRVVGA
ncbi:MAG: SpoIIE family protein phosphatase [Candidatus Sericytochromatia bacterium]|nr:SpoIIE family protein phosphatase [Candidatus Tanganyikabacteria bacterium]